MTWIRLEDRFPEHPKMLGLSDAAFRLYISALCYSGGQLTDGLIQKVVLKRLGRSSVVAELVEAGLWEVSGEDYQIHDYLKHQSSREQVEAGKEASRKRAERYRDKRESNGVINGVSAVEITAPDTDTDTDTDISSENQESLNLANLLADKIAQNGSKKPKVSKAWITEIDRMMKIDGRTAQEIKGVIEWSQADPFWRSNILSPAKLRAKYDQMRLKAFATVPSSVVTSPTPTPPKFDPSEYAPRGGKRPEGLGKVAGL